MSDELSKAEEIERRLAALGVREEDLVEKFVRASGPGGQKVNKTSAAVYLKHVPSGVEIKVQTTRSQAANRLRARIQLAEQLEARREAEEQAARQRAEKRRRQRRKRPARVQRQILEGKRRQAEKKRQRARVKPEGSS